MLRVSFLALGAACLGRLSGSTQTLALSRQRSLIGPGTFQDRLGKGLGLKWVSFSLPSVQQSWSSGWNRRPVQSSPGVWYHITSVFSRTRLLHFIEAAARGGLGSWHLQCPLLSRRMAWERARSGWLVSRSGPNYLAALAQKMSPAHYQAQT